MIAIATSLAILFLKSEYNKKKLKASKPVVGESGLPTNNKDAPDAENLIQTPNKPDENRSILQTYKLVWSILKLNAIRKLIFIFLTVRVGFATEYTVRLKLIEMGVEREKISLLSVIVSPILTILPFLLRNYVNGPKPLDLFRTAYLFK